MYVEVEGVPFTQRPGGAVLLGELIRHVAEKVNENLSGAAAWDVEYRRDVTDGSYNDFPNLYSIWHEYEKPREPHENGRVEPVWRISQFLGTQQAASPRKPQKAVLKEGSRPELIVLDDKGHGFSSDEGWWRPYTSDSLDGAWFLVRCGRPLLKHKMWGEILKAHCSRLIAVTTADDVRQSEVFVSRQLSWERTAQDLYWEVLKSNALQEFQKCAFIVVCFTASAAILFENGGGRRQPGDDGPRCRLVYNPTSLEEEEWRDQRSGLVQGFTHCVMAAIARSFFESAGGKPTFEQLTEAIQRGLDASQGLYKEGFELKVEADGVRFPVERVVKQVTEAPSASWGVVEVPRPPLDPAGDLTVDESWAILKGSSKEMPRDLHRLAEEVVTKGVEVLIKDLPVYRLGELLVADRQEIEGYRSIRRLLNEYTTQKPGVSGSRPLSIGVFGPPGSGKSFGIKQLAKHAFKGVEFKPLTFNLSQLTNPDDLRGAFHQIRDEALRGKLPLVFWDEFDSTLKGEDLGWLRYFLAPMQDGLFQEGQITHPIGRSVFIFAGGTAYTMGEFKEKYLDKDKETAKRSKVPDFISRLRGYLDIRGLNPHQSKEEDQLYIIRRAIVLNGQLNERAPRSIVKRGKDGKEEFIIDEGVLRALLTVSEYKHGARSMEAVISMSILSGRNRFERSSLPPRAQLELHVPAEEFNWLLWNKPAGGRPQETQAEL
jgi:hypothetical protein